MTSQTARTALKASAGVMMLGSVCPWASLLGLASASGLAVHFGWISLLAGAAILALLSKPELLSRHQRRAAVTLAVIGAVVCMLVVLGASHSQDGAALQASWGAYLTLAASITAAFTARKVLA